MPPEEHGHWSLHELPPGVKQDDAALGTMKSDSAATGLALLTYLGAGYTHLDDKHRSVVDRGLDWLIRHQADNGDLFTGGRRDRPPGSIATASHRSPCARPTA